jgi:hypothetical protein
MPTHTNAELQKLYQSSLDSVDALKLMFAASASVEAGATVANDDSVVSTCFMLQ